MSTYHKKKCMLGCISYFSWSLALCMHTTDMLPRRQTILSCQCLNYHDTNQYFKLKFSQLQCTLIFKKWNIGLKDINMYVKSVPIRKLHLDLQRWCSILSNSDERLEDWRGKLQMMVDDRQIEEARQIFFWCWQSCNSGFNSNYFINLWNITDRYAAFDIVKRSQIWME